MLRLAPQFAVTVLALGAIAACSTIAPTLRAGGGPVAGGGFSGFPSEDAVAATPGRAGGRDTTLLGRPRDRATRVPNDRGQLDVRRVCRSASVPRGWIAVGYEGASPDCPRSTAAADSVAAVAVIVRYAGASVGTRLDVCADQSIPRGWSPVEDESAGDPGSCPHATRSGDTAQRIQRGF